MLIPPLYSNEIAIFVYVKWPMKIRFTPTIQVNLQFKETHYSQILHWKTSCSTSARIAILITFILGNFALLYRHFNTWLTVNFIFDKMNIFYFNLSKPLSVNDYRYFDPNQNSQVVLVFVHIQKNWRNVRGECSDKRRSVWTALSMPSFQKGMSMQSKTDIWLFSRWE